MPLNTEATYGLLLALAQALQETTLVGSPAPFVRELLERRRRPVPGDWVAEATAIARGHRAGVGRLIAVQPTRFYKPVEGPASPLAETWHLETLEGDLVSWTNCTFLALPSQLPTPGSGRSALDFFPSKVERAVWVADALVRHGLDGLEES